MILVKRKGTPGRFRSAGDAVAPETAAAIGNRMETRWTATGRQRHVATWFGLAKIWIEESRMVYRPRYSSNTRANWTAQTRWRRARRRDRAILETVVTFDTVAEARA